jgi:hypothetical protein
MGECTPNDAGIVVDRVGVIAYSIIVVRPHFGSFSFLPAANMARIANAIAVFFHQKWDCHSGG